jgi:phosphonate transport system permease protein
MHQYSKRYSHEVWAAYEKRPRTWWIKLLAILIFLALAYWSMYRIPNAIDDTLDGMNVVRSVLYGLMNPTFDKIFTLKKFGAPYLMLETVMIAFLGTLIGTIYALPLSVLGARNITNRYMSFLMNVVVVLIRTLPFFVIGLIFIRVVGPGTFAGVLSIGFTSTGMITKLYTESIEDIDRGILDALDSSGASQLQKLRAGILPQLFANFSSHSLYRFDINVRNAIILGLISGGLGFELNAAIGNFRYRDAAAYLWIIIIVVLMVEFSSSALRKRLVYGKRG